VYMLLTLGLKSSSIVSHALPQPPQPIMYNLPASTCELNCKVTTQLLETPPVKEKEKVVVSAGALAVSDSMEPHHGHAKERCWNLDMIHSVAYSGTTDIIITVPRRDTLSMI
jgi:hypothetical protein